MNPRFLVKLSFFLLVITGIGAGSELTRSRGILTDVEPARSAQASDCSFQQNPEKFRTALRRHMEDLSVRNQRLSRRIAYSPAIAAPEIPVNTTSVPLTGYIDEHIFGKMEEDSVPHAPLASDSEFLRRVTLDLTGRIPNAADVRAFVGDDNPRKRSDKITKLVGSPEFVDKWTMYYGDLFKNTARDSNVARAPEGRNEFQSFIKDAVGSDMPYDVLVEKLITGAGTDSFKVGEANWVIGGITPMGPIQDTYDTLAVRTATQFLGLSNIDCLLCHDGAGHLDTLNLWGAETKRSEAWQLAAFFSRTQIRRVVTSQSPLQYYWSVSDLQSGDYRLNTSSGNRTARQAVDGSSVVKPDYFFSDLQATGSTYREMLANNLVLDRQFARAAVNYLWREMMGMGIVEPADQFDLARLDPGSPPPDGWTLQPSHPELLEALADDFIGSGYDVRHMLSQIANSSAYQLSSRFDGEWKLEYEAYFARKNIRRLWAEEVHDAITAATGVGASYTPQGYSSPIQWAMQLPDTVEPRSNAGASSFLNYFLRGDRDQNLRSDDATILQALNMMNNTFVTTRIRSSNRNSTVGKLTADRSLSDSRVVEELFLSTLSRFPGEQELQAGLDALRANRTSGAENLQWVLLNKIDFLYNY